MDGAEILSCVDGTSLPEFLKHKCEFVEEKNINDEWL